MKNTTSAVVAVIVVVCITIVIFSGCIEQDESPKLDLALSNYLGLFKVDVIIVIGDNAPQVEREAAEAIAINLENLTGNKPIIKSDEEITGADLGDYNLLLVGTPESNNMFKEVYNMTDATMVTDEYPGAGKGILEILENPWSEEKAMLLVEGSDVWGVKAGSEMLVKGGEKFQGKIIITEQVKEDFTYTFIWGQDEQDIIPGTLCLNITRIGQTRFVIKVNDNDYNEWDCLSMVFDRNQNGIIDLGNTDQPHGLWANNLTAPVVLLENGDLIFAEIPPKAGPHRCTFDENKGYIFDVSFSNLSELESILLRVSFVDKDVPYGDIGVVTTNDTTIHLEDF